MALYYKKTITSLLNDNPLLKKISDTARYFTVNSGLRIPTINNDT